VLLADVNGMKVRVGTNASRNLMLSRATKKGRDETSRGNTDLMRAKEEAFLRRSQPVAANMVGTARRQRELHNRAAA
jgi:hypothetical protein